MFIFPSGIPSGASGYQLKGAIFTDGSDDYFSKTDYSTSGSSDKVMSCGGWFKVCEIDDAQTALFAWTRSNDSNDYVRMGHYYQTGQIRLVLQDTSDTGRLDWYTTQRMRDPTAWFHIVWTVSTNGEAVNKLWINGSEITDFTKTTDGLADGQTFRFGNSDHNHSLFADPNGSANNKSIYASQMFYQDGQKVTDITDYGEFNDNGIWVPKDISGLTFGTNGYLLDFADENSLGNDVSGRNNDLTVHGSMSSANWTYDRPVNDGTDTGNQCTFNPIFANNATNNAPTFTNGNLTATSSSGAKTAVSTIPIPLTGKWSCKVTKGALSGSYDWFNLMVSKASNFPQDTTNPQQGSDTLALVYSSANGTVKIFEEGTEEVSITSWGTGTGNVEALVDRDANTIKWYMNGSRIQDGGSDYTTSIPSDLQGEDCYFTFFVEQADISITMNYTASDTDYSVALATQNLPEPTITKPSDYFQAKAYEGTDASTLTVDTNFQADWVLIKERTNSRSWHLYDIVRGERFALYTNGAWVEDENEVNGYLDQFNETNVRLTNGTTSGVNVKGSSDSNTYVMYAMKAGGKPTASNDNTPSDGAMDANSVIVEGVLQSSYAPSGSPTIYPSKMSINRTAGFSIVGYTGNSTADATVPHGLSSTPELIIVRNREGAESWAVWHKALDSGKRLDLNLQAAQFTTSNYIEGVNGDVFQLSSSGAVINNGDDFIAYCWHSVEGFSKIGSYTGNNSAGANGVYIHLGFKPAFFLTKCISASGGWFLWDSARSIDNPVEHVLFPNDSPGENNRTDTTNATEYQGVDFLANGVKFRNEHDDCNGNGTTNIYMAFAETPFASNNRAR